MRLKQWREFRYKDTEYLQNIQDAKTQQALQRQGYDAAEIDQYMRESKEAAEKPALIVPTGLADMAQDFYGELQSGAMAPTPHQVI
jgi:hypothetical protein